LGGVNGILKNEYLLDSCFKSIKQAKQACSQGIEMYNIRRPHWALNFKIPQEVHEMMVKNVFPFTVPVKTVKEKKGTK
jgi:transposase InsO family protein